MPKDTKEYMKEYRLKNKEKRAEYKKQYDKKYKEKKAEYNKEYRLKNKEKQLQKNKEYKLKNPEKTIKCVRIAKWKSRGVISDDFDKLYEYYLSIDECENCGIELNQDASTKKCLDHCHDTGLFRNVLCNCCNVIRG